MARFDDFVDFKDYQIDDVVQILQNRGVTIDVFRPDPSYTGSVGFSQELGAYIRIDRILALVAPLNDFKYVGRDDIKESMGTYIGITNYTDIRLSDDWRLPDGTKYRVKGFSKELDHIVQVYLERLYA